MIVACVRVFFFAEGGGFEFRTLVDGKTSETIVTTTPCDAGSASWHLGSNGFKIDGVGQVAKSNA